MRVTVVTGAASGIGRATVERLADGGGSVVAVDRCADSFDWLSDRTERVHVVAGDVTDPETNAQAVDAALEHFGRLDALVCNAGVSMGGDLVDLAMEEFDRAMDVNVRAVVLGIRAAAPVLREQGDGGRIVVTASTSGIAGDPNLWAYNTSKGAVVNLVRAAALDLGPDGITVNAVCPGPTDTAMTSRLAELPEAYEDLRRRIPVKRWGRPEEIAAAIAFLVSADASFVNGAILPVDGGVGANVGLFTPREPSE